MVQEQRQVPSRFTDNPFRDPNLPPEKAAWLDKRNEALRYYYQTGDPGPAAEFGFTLADRRQEKAIRKAVQEARNSVPR